VAKVKVQSRETVPRTSNKIAIPVLALVGGAVVFLFAACAAEDCSGRALVPDCATPTRLVAPAPTPRPLVPLAVAPGGFAIPIPIDLTTRLISPLTGTLDGCGSPPGPIVTEPTRSGSYLLQLSADGTVTDPVGDPGSNTSPLLGFAIEASEIEPGPGLPPTAGQSIDVAGSTELTKAIADGLTGLRLDDSVPTAQVSAGVNLTGWYAYLSQTGQQTTTGILNISLPNRCGVYNLTLTIELQ
jgi:hypothetical protein